MKLIKRTFVTVAVFAFAAMLVLLATVLTLAACSEKVTLRFETFDGTPISSVEGEAGKGYPKPNEPEKEGYYFDGWYLEEDLSGEKEDLPAVMPQESRTYYAKYAKYPVLTLDLDGGTAEKTEHLIKPGVSLTEYLRSFEPQKWGLKFGAWERDGVLLSADETMPDGDLTLKARYKASYSVDVYLQNEDMPALFDRSETLSLSGSDWEGSLFTPEAPVLEHFTLNEEKTTLESLVLRAGENRLSVYFMREAIDLRYLGGAEEGGSEKIIHTRYGAHVAIEPAPVAPEHMEFFGWATEQGGPASEKYRPESLVTVEEPLTLYGAWADVYQSARGGATLSVARYANEGERAAVYREGELRAEGVFREEDQSFRAGEYAGRLGEKHFFLPDDTGAYAGFDLLLNGASERCGTLSLRFSDGTAVYALGGSSVSGSYAYVYDEAAGEYTGKYEFFGRSRSEGFSFLLEEEYFLREGEEKGEYALFDPLSEQFDDTVTLCLDGFGGALLTVEGINTAGGYAGAEGAKDWQFSAGETVFRFLVGESLFHAEEDYAGASGFMLYHEDAAGSFTAEGAALTLDGYCYCAEYTCGEERLSGRYERSGKYVTLYAESTLTFTLNGDTFALSGAERGEYSGEKGALLLDGAGGAELGGAAGTYAPYGADEWQFSSAAEIFRFRLQEKAYAVFKQELFRIYEGFYGIRLELDGYGGGVYVDYTKARIPVTVSYFDGENFEIRSTAFSDPLYFRLDGGELLLVQSREAGHYLVYENGERTERTLYLDGAGGARLYDGSAERGEYTYSASGEARLLLGERTLYFLLKEGRVAVLKDRAQSFYSESGTLTLDGYGNAVYRGKDTVSGSYLLTEDGAELTSGEKLWKFRFDGEKLKEISVYTRYENPFGLPALYLGEDGAAILGGESGRYTLGEICSFEGRESFLFKLGGGEYLRYDAEQAGEYAITPEGKLLLDGCGGAIYYTGNTSVSGSGYREGDRIVFVSDKLTTLSGKLAFAYSGGALLPLGTEFGEYALFQGKCDLSCVLRLFGDGTAEYAAGGKTHAAHYRAAESADKYVLSLYGREMRVRLEKHGDTVCFAVYGEALSALTGSYTSESGVLSIDGYSVTLAAETRQTFAVCRAAGNAVFVKDGEGRLLCILLEGETFRIVSARMEFYLK